MFYHSLVSDWNHGNAHFLRGVATELRAKGHEVVIYEPQDAWSARNLALEHGEAPLRAFEDRYPGLTSQEYDRQRLRVDEWLEGADAVLVHEWNDHELVREIGKHRARTGGYALLFHDTHHRMVSDPASMDAYELEHYDGVLAYGEVLRQLYLARGRAAAAWTWHEAADTRIFHPYPASERDGDVVWIGNWGDDERSAELREFLCEPVRELRLRARVYGVRYPASAKASLAEAGIEYAGWLPNFEVPRVFARFRVTVHIPRRPYVSALPGIPTIRPFEALACGIPLVCSPWTDAEHLFRPNEDFLVAANGKEMKDKLQQLLSDERLSAQVAANGLETIRRWHTCAHRVDELLAIVSQIRGGRVKPPMGMARNPASCVNA